MEIFQLQTSELWFLFSQFPPAFVLGIDNPYTGWLADEIEIQNKNAIEGLLSKGFANQLDDETLDIHDELFDMIKTCAHPLHTIILQISLPDNASQQVYYHFNETEIIEHTTNPAGEHLLQKYLSMEIFFDRVFSLLNLNPDILGNGKVIKIPEDTLSKSIDMLSGKHDTSFEEYMHDIDLSLTEIEKIKRALTKPVANSSIAILLNQENPDGLQVRGFGLLQSSTDFWMMQPYNNNENPKIELIPTTIQSVKEKLTEITPAIKDYA